MASVQLGDQRKGGNTPYAQRLTADTISATPPPKFPYAENLVYRVGWRMVTAGQANLKLTSAANNGWQLNLDLVSSGLVNQLYRVLDTYKLSTNEKFCASSVNLDAQEGKHHNLTNIAFDNDNHKLVDTTKDLIGNESKKTELTIPPCTYDIAGALMTLHWGIPMRPRTSLQDYLGE